jgi:hypothetical protein
MCVQIFISLCKVGNFRVNRMYNICRPYIEMHNLKYPAFMNILVQGLLEPKQNNEVREPQNTYR